ncbi:hypothetical protein [Ruegeria sp. HKCCD7559]|uniref:hypothetical protein n=1 Tax=Ruegeria sp. HKCCD7559 TaxID=2683005 RepID=UPI0014927A12|nr:hypothetical protein [Ruegeria sp. HKCCD7559]NOC46111.1 hypothetical protein [Ruegeria sp. HKCCD7559]
MSYFCEHVLERHLEEYRAASITEEAAKPPSMGKINHCGCPDLFPEHMPSQASRRSSQRNEIHAKLKKWVRSGRVVSHADVYRAWKVHSTLREFAKHFSIRTPFAARVLDTYGICFSETLAQRFRLGELLPDLANEQGISQKLLVKIIQVTGTTVSKGRRRPMYDEAKVALRYAEVKSVRRIQIEFGMSWATADKIVREIGLK